jgi:hypothetical protein
MERAVVAVRAGAVVVGLALGACTTGEGSPGVSGTTDGGDAGGSVGAAGSAGAGGNAGVAGTGGVAGAAGGVAGSAGSAGSSGAGGAGGSGGGGAAGKGGSGGNTAGSGGTAGTGGTGGAAGQAGSPADAGGDAMGDCLTCGKTKCATEYETCSWDWDCKKALDCFISCMKVGAEAPLDCALGLCYLSGKYQALTNCIFTKCQYECQ